MDFFKREIIKMSYILLTKKKEEKLEYIYFLIPKKQHLMFFAHKFRVNVLLF